MDESKRAYGHAMNTTLDRTGWLSSTWETSLVVATLSTGTFLDALVSDVFADHFERRSSLHLACCFFTVGAGVQLTGTTVAVLVVGRLIVEVGVAVVPATSYIDPSEIISRRSAGPFCHAISLLSLSAWCLLAALPAPHRETRIRPPSD